MSKLVLALTAPMFLLAACGGGGNSSDDGIDDRVGASEPKIRFVHAANLGPKVTLFRDGKAVPEATDVDYKFATSYLKVDTGDTDLAIKTESGQQGGETIRVDADRGHKYTFVALPNASLPPVDFAVIDDPYDKPLLSDRARVRVLNAAANAGEIDVYLTRGTNTDVTTATPRFPAIGFKRANPASGDDSIELDDGTYQLQITAAGTKTVIFNQTVDLDDNVDWLLTVVPSGGLGSVVPGSVKVLLVKSDDSNNTTTEITSK
ncbi:DUF4397 domain-containing protein [Caldimonas brevitalea]|nr:DUF4397 domain-containing protein [Caldimonas brevitalea]